MTLFSGLGPSTYQLGTVAVTVLRRAGPRVIAYQPAGFPDLFAKLPDEVIEHPAVGEYRFLGGHRLWRAPESPSVTYQPDIEPVSVQFDGVSLSVHGQEDRDGMVKTIVLTQVSEFTVVDHVLENRGTRAVDTAPWSITQLVPGGAAILPLSRAEVDEDGLRPNHSITFWPYTDMRDPGLTWERAALRIAADGGEKFKIGQSNTLGWLAYAKGTDVFVKWSPLHDDATSYPHLGSSVECYRDSRFVELESVGPMHWVDPGERVDHREVWRMYDVRDRGLNDLLASLPTDPMS